MVIHVEFFGISRARSGVGQTTVLEDQEAATLGDVFQALAERFPRWAEACLDNGNLRGNFVASVDGQAFVRDRRTLVSAGQSVLILSTDAGG